MKKREVKKRFSPKGEKKGSKKPVVKLTTNYFCLVYGAYPLLVSQKKQKPSLS
jgi:hypothetical protein